jgi:hypothetical protein
MRLQMWWQNWCRKIRPKSSSTISFSELFQSCLASSSSSRETIGKTKAEKFRPSQNLLRRLRMHMKRRKKREENWCLQTFFHFHLWTVLSQVFLCFRIRVSAAVKTMIFSTIAEEPSQSYNTAAGPSNFHNLGGLSNFCSSALPEKWEKCYTRSRGPVQQPASLWKKTKKSFAMIYCFARAEPKTQGRREENTGAGSESAAFYISHVSHRNWPSLYVQYSVVTHREELI